MQKITAIQLVGYDTKTETGELTNATLFEIIADTETEAVEIAKKLLAKPNYALKTYVETYKVDETPYHTVFFVDCFTQHNPEQKIYYDHVLVQAIAENAEQALEKSKQIVKRPFYKVSTILQK